ncbi:MAG TPA: polysaccharide deacetylase family protein, partial [Candidatus Methylomirabilis sp.]
RAQRRFEAFLKGPKAGARARRPRPVWARARVAAPAAAMIVAVAAAAVAFVPRHWGSAPPPPPAAEPEVSLPPPEARQAPELATPLPAQPAPRRDLANRPRARSPFAVDISRGAMEVREVALTFDGGDDSNATEAILDALVSRGVRATMFLTGRYIRRHPDLVRRMLAEGHEVGNHTNTHPHLTSYARDGRQTTLPNVTREFLQAQLRAAEEAFREVAGRPFAPFWRAPYGEHNGEIRAWAAEAGYRHVGWTRDPAGREDLDSRDWVADPTSNIYRSSREIRDRILGFGQGNGHGLNGGIVLMHLGTGRRTDPAHARLPEILDGLAARGYRLVPVSELLRDVAPPPEVARLDAR